MWPKPNSGEVGPTVIAGQSIKMTCRHWRVSKSWWTLKEGRPLREGNHTGENVQCCCFCPGAHPVLHGYTRYLDIKQRVQYYWFKKSENKTEQLATEGRNPGKEGMRELKKGEPPNL